MGIRQTECFAPIGPLVADDVTLAQKIAIETDEAGALQVAKSFKLHLALMFEHGSCLAGLDDARSVLTRPGGGCFVGDRSKRVTGLADNVTQLRGRELKTPSQNLYLDFVP